MFIWILKKYPKLLKEKKIEIKKETKDKRVSRVYGKYYNELPEAPDIGDWNILKLEFPREKLNKLGIFNMAEWDYYYMERREFDHKKDGFSCVESEYFIEYNTGISGIKRLFYDILTGNHENDSKYPNLTGKRFDIKCNTLEELHDIYLYFLKLKYHTKIISSNSDPRFIKRKKFKTTQKAKYLGCVYPYYTVTVMLKDNWQWLLKFWESFELLYQRLGYTFEREPIDIGFHCNRFSMIDFKKLILNKRLNYGDII